MAIKESKSIAVLALLGSGLASWLIANLGAPYDKMELGGLLVIFGPLFVTLVTLLLFYFIDWILPRIRWVSAVLLMAVNIVYSLQLRNEIL